MYTIHIIHALMHGHLKFEKSEKCKNVSYLPVN